MSDDENMDFTRRNFIKMVGLGCKHPAIQHTAEMLFPMAKL